MFVKPFHNLAFFNQLLQNPIDRVKQLFIGFFNGDAVAFRIKLRDLIGFKVEIGIVGLYLQSSMSVDNNYFAAVADILGGYKRVVVAFNRSAFKAALGAFFIGDDIARSSAWVPITLFLSCAPDTMEFSSNVKVPSLYTTY